MLRIWCAVLLLCCLNVCSAASSITGDWFVIDDDDGKPSAIVTLTEEGKGLQGRIKQVIAAAGEDPDPRCTKCKGERRDQKVNGMLILWGMTGQRGEYAGGEILDPETGEVYRCKIMLAADGKSLEVRAFVGLSLFGRTQKWARVSGMQSP